MKLGITKGKVHHDRDNRNTDYIQLYIGYDFNPDIYMTVRRYPRNTHLQLVNGETKILIKEPNEDFVIGWWLSEISGMFSLIYSERQKLAIYQYWEQIENYS